MILTGSEIHKQVQQHRIIIAPYNSSNINPNSYNYHLGFYYSIAGSNTTPHMQTTVYRIPSTGFLLYPGTVLLSTTYEIIGSSEFVTSLIGRSSVGRLGLFLQISADLGQLGKAHKWTLELTCVQPVIVYPLMKIGQVSFWVPLGDHNLYSGRYANFNFPHGCTDVILNGMDK